MSEFQAYVSAIRLALDEKAAVAKFNRSLPLKDKRKKSRKLPAKHKAMLAFEAESKRVLKKRSPEKWASAIAKVKPSTLRSRVAKLIWWDYFGGRLSSQRWPHLDSYLDTPFVTVSDEDLKMALHQCGYTPWMATMRTDAGVES